MKRSLWRVSVAASALMGGTLALLVSGVHALAQEPAMVTRTIEVPNLVEAWYRTAPGSICGAPIGCLPGLPSSYAERTLHVGVALGAEDSRTYVGLDPARLPDHAEVLGGTMTLPVAADQEAGSENVSSASLRACIVVGVVADGVDGAGGPVPDVDCGVSAPLVLDDAGDSFQLDLDPFFARWEAGEPARNLALLPADGGELTANWHVAFNRRDRSAEATPILSTITVSLPAETSNPPNTADAPPVTALPAAGGASTTAADDLPAAVPGAVDRRSDSESRPATRLRAQPAFGRTSPLRYRGVVYLPLIFLAAITFLARTFTRPVVVRRSVLP